MISEDSFYDHYKDTFEILKGYLAKRDHFTIALLAMVVVSCLKIVNPDLLNESISGIINTQISGLKFTWSYLSVFVSYLFLWIVMQYYQSCLTIENTYDYIHQLEEKISVDGDYKIRREGHNYLQYYPWFKWLIHRIYVLLIPLLLSCLAVVDIIGEIQYLCISQFCLADILSLCADGLIVILSFLYLSNRWLHEDAFSKKAYPNLSWGKRLAAYLGMVKLHVPSK